MIANGTGVFGLVHWQTAAALELSPINALSWGLSNYGSVLAASAAFEALPGLTSSGGVNGTIVQDGQLVQAGDRTRISTHPQSQTGWVIYLTE
jgi:hypothetical protein